MNSVVASVIGVFAALFSGVFLSAVLLDPYMPTHPHESMILLGVAGALGWFAFFYKIK